ncbi:MAG TPA: carbonic anhydrase, partial [Polyangiaceae bacterium]|nr:carbonic anhydrase [Polyangiaceae bacterium]
EIPGESVVRGAMSYLRSTLASAVLLATACQTAAADNHPAAAASAEPPAHAAAAPVGSESAHDKAPKKADPNRSYTLPFVRDPDTEDPSDRARAFLRDVTRDNASFMRSHDAKFFKPFADAQKPRATVVACSDSRVQSPAFDASPENDLFTIRNIGNQLATAEGSVEYGVEHLKTPVLLIVGHSGCGAVKAAMGDFSSQPGPVRRELATIDLSPLAAKGDGKKDGKEGRPSEKREAEKGRGSDTVAWMEAVVVNVHHQVAAALERYAERVAIHDLVVVGAVYDFRNDTRLGFGSFNIVNVNGHTDAAKIGAFTKALDERAPSGERASSERLGDRTASSFGALAKATTAHEGHSTTASR